jgi:hypothetical protein
MQTRVETGTMSGVALPEGGPALPPRISWGAVFAGGIVAIAVGAMLNVLGLAVGATTIDPAVPGETPSASSFGIASGIWLLVANLIGLAVGGYVAARLSGTSDDTDGILHGLSVWAIAFLLSAVLLGNIVAGTTRTAFTGLSSIVGGAAQGAGQAVQAAASQVDVNPQALVERAQAALRGAGGDPGAMTSEQRNAEIAQILTRDATTAGPMPQGDRDRLTQLVAAEYGISPQEAQARLQQVEQQVTQAAQQAEQTARQAAEVAADATAAASYWIFAAMLLGAVAAVLGARMGTRNAVRLAARRYA